MRSLIFGRNVKWYNHFGNSLVVSLKTKYKITIQPESALLGIYPRETVDVCSHRNLCRTIYSTFIPNSPKLGTTQMSSTGEYYRIILSK